MIELIEDQAAGMTLLACAGKTLPSGIPVDPCQTCARRGADAVALASLLDLAVVFVETGPKVGWQCSNHRAYSSPS